MVFCSLFIAILYPKDATINYIFAESISALPRNERQARYLKAKQQPQTPDPISALLDMQLEEETTFIQSETVDKNSLFIFLSRVDAFVLFYHGCSQLARIANPRKGLLPCFQSS